MLRVAASLLISMSIVQKRLIKEKYYSSSMIFFDNRSKKDFLKIKDEVKGLSKLSLTRC